MVAAPLVLLLSGCDLGHPGGFTARSNSYCAQSARQINALARPADAQQQLQYAIDRYTAIERLVSEMTDSSLPGGQDGTQLRQRWLRPARASLVDGRAVLAALRDAMNRHDVARADAEFDRSLAIGTQQVDTALLRASGLSDCASVFTPTVRQT